MNDTSQLFLAVPGPEQMKPFPIRYIREALTSGEIEPSRLVWSERDSEWKPLEEVAHLLNAKKAVEVVPKQSESITPLVKKAVEVAPIQSEPIAPVAKNPVERTPVSTRVAPPKLDPATEVKKDPRPVAANDFPPNLAAPGRPAHKISPAPMKMDSETTPIGSTPKVAKIPTAAKPGTVAIPKPKVGSTTASLPMKVSAPTASYTRPIRERHDRYTYILRLIAFGSFALLASLLSINYFFVEQPFQNNLVANGLGREVTVHAHLGGFYQKNIVVIHLIPGPGVTKSNFLDILVTLAKSTPSAPFESSMYEAVSLTPAWTSHYIFKGEDWAKLASMENVPANRKIVLIINALQDSDGKPYLDSDENAKNVDNADFQLDEREKRAWDNFLAIFTPAS